VNKDVRSHLAEPPTTGSCVDRMWTVAAICRGVAGVGPVVFAAGGLRGEPRDEPGSPDVLEGLIVRRSGKRGQHVARRLGIEPAGESEDGK
jgi:hypothetical protein